MIKYLVVTDGGDSDISHLVVDTEEEANDTIAEEEENIGYTAYTGIFKIDFDAQTITRTFYCQ